MTTQFMSFEIISFPIHNLASVIVSAKYFNELYFLFYYITNQVREGRKPGKSTEVEDLEARIAEVLVMVQVYFNQVFCRKCFFSILIQFYWQIELYFVL